MAKKNLWIPVLEAVFAVIAWGASFVATKVALRSVSPVTVVWLRFGMGMVILGAAVWLRGQFAWPSRRDLGYFALLGFLGITFHQALQATGLLTSQATTGAWLVSTTPVFMALLGWLVLREKLVREQAVGIALATLGVLLVITRGDLRSLASIGTGGTGNLLMLFSSLNWAVFSTLSRRGLRQHPATRMMFYVMAAGWLFTSLWLITGPGFAEIPHLPLDGWVGVGFLGIFCSGLAYLFWYDALQALPVAQTGAFLYVEPFVTIIVAAILLGEPLLAASLLGGSIILLGVWLVNRPANSARTALPGAKSPSLVTDRPRE